MNDTETQVPSELDTYIRETLQEKGRIEGFDAQSATTLFLLTRKGGELVKTIIEPHPLVTVGSDTVPELLALMFAFYARTGFIHVDVAEAIDASDEFVGLLLFNEASGLILDVETHEEAVEKAREMVGKVEDHENSVAIKFALLALDFNNFHVYSIHEGEDNPERTDQLAGSMRVSMTAMFALYQELCRK